MTEQRDWFETADLRVVLHCTNAGTPTITADITNTGSEEILAYGVGGVVTIRPGAAETVTFLQPARFGVSTA